MCIQTQLKVSKEGVERNLIGRDLNRDMFYQIKCCEVIREMKRGRSGKMSCICEVNVNNKKY